MDFKIQYGKFENLPIEGEIGTVYYTTDTHQLFVCLLDTKVLEEIKVSEAEQATELYYLNDNGEKILLTPEEITSIGTTLLQNVKNNQLIIGNEEGELISLEGLNTEEGLISSILEIDADGMIQQHSVLPPRLGGTGLSVQAQTTEAVIKELLKKAESEDIKQLIDNAGNGSNRITYTTVTDSINDETITLKQYYGFDEGVTYKIKLNEDLPANAAIAESNASNAKKYPIVDLKGNAMRGGEAIKDSYIELTYSDGKFFFKGGGGERPRKLKGFVEFTTPGEYVLDLADYGLQTGDNIDIVLVAGGGTGNVTTAQLSESMGENSEIYFYRNQDLTEATDIIIAEPNLNLGGIPTYADYSNSKYKISGAGGGGGYVPPLSLIYGTVEYLGENEQSNGEAFGADDFYSGHDEWSELFNYDSADLILGLDKSTGGGFLASWGKGNDSDSSCQFYFRQKMRFPVRASDADDYYNGKIYNIGLGGAGYGAGGGAAAGEKPIRYSGYSGSIIKKQNIVQNNQNSILRIKIGSQGPIFDGSTNTLGTPGYCKISWDIDETI